MVKKLSQHLWIKRKETDKYFFSAKAYGYRARSAYKLIEINNKFKIIKKNMIVADLGAAPGSWSQILAETLFMKNKNCNSKIYAIDIQSIEPIENVIVFKKDINNFITESSLIKENSLDLVLSDMSPKATGHRFTDQIRASDLAEKAVYFAQKYLSFKGSFVCKLLGANTNDTLLKDIKKHYKEVKLFKPKSSMKDSKEIYLVCLGFNNLQ